MLHVLPVVTKDDTEQNDSGFETCGLVGKRIVASFLGVTVRTVEKLQSEGLPFYRITPRRNGYLLAEVKEWLARSRRGYFINRQ